MSTVQSSPLMPIATVLVTGSIPISTHAYQVISHILSIAYARDESYACILDAESQADDLLAEIIFLQGHDMALYVPSQRS